MTVCRFVHRLPDDVILAGRNVEDHRRVFQLIFNLKLHPVAHRNRVGDFEAFNFELPFQPGAVNMSVFIANVVPGTG